MRMLYSVRDTPWMCGWEPLMEWMRAHGMNPHNVFRFELAHDAPEIQVSAYVNDRHGQRVIDHTRGEVRTVDSVFVLRSFPPDKDPDGNVLRPFPSERATLAHTPK